METPLHFDCIEDCCWSRRLEAAGGPTTVTGVGILSALAQGTLLSTDDGIEFQWDKLPTWTRADLDEAERLRDAFVQSVRERRSQVKVRPGTERRTLRGTPEVRACVEKAVELGAKSPELVSEWLGIEPKFFTPSWFTQPAVDRMIRLGYSNAEIVRESIDIWGHPVTTSGVSQRRRRMAPQVVSA